MTRSRQSEIVLLPGYSLKSRNKKKHAVNMPETIADKGRRFPQGYIRMKDQPFVHTEESIAAGCPPDLL